MLFTTLLIAASTLVAEAGGQDCTDDRGHDRCTGASQARMRALYGLKSIEEHAGAGEEARRVFYVDGYGRDLIAIAFVRAPARDPAVSVHFPRRDGERPSPPLHALVPHSAWQDLSIRSQLFDRELAPRRQPETEICMHSWVYLAEASEPARQNRQRSSVRRKTDDACNGGPVQAFASEVARAALPLLPYCDRLDPRQHRNPASQLSACRILSGDRMAAAEALNRIRSFPDIGDPRAGERLGGLFAHETSIEWGGDRRQLDSGSARHFWVAKLAESGRSNIHFEQVQGIAADRAKVTALLSRHEEAKDGREGRYNRAPVEFTMTFGPAQEWVISEAKVGAWLLEPMAR